MIALPKPQDLGLYLHQVQILPYLREGAGGPLFGEAVLTKGRVEPGRYRVSNAQKTEIVANLFLLLPEGTRYGLGSEIRWRLPGQQLWQGPYTLVKLEPIYDLTENHVEAYAQ